MPLNLYRRHFRTPGKCTAEYEPDFRNYETDELRRGWKKCHCPIYAAGTLGRKFNRKNTKKITWAEAKAVVAQWEAAGKWDDEVAPVFSPLPTPTPTSAPDGITIERAVAAFLAEHAESLAPNTQRKYRMILSRLKEHSAAKGYVMIDQWTPIDVREFRASWGVSHATATKNMSSVKAFFEFSLSNEWLDRNPARLVRNPRSRANADPRNEERIPFSDDELKRMFEACETQYAKRPIRWSRNIHKRPAEPGVVANYK